MTLRLAVAAAVLISAVVHLQLWLDGMRAVAVVGPAFLLNAVGGAVIAVAVVAWRSWLPLLAAVAFGLSTLAAFLVSVTVGLFGVQERLIGVPQVVSAVTEIAAVVLGGWALVRERRPQRALSPSPPGRPRPRRRRTRAAGERDR